VSQGYIVWVGGDDDDDDDEMLVDTVIPHEKNLQNPNGFLPCLYLS